MDRLYQLSALIPAGTPQAVPVTIPWPLEDNQLLSIDIMVPDGPSGLMGFFISQAQQQIVPWGNSGFLITNDEKIRYEYSDQISSTGLAVVGYNTDIYNHTVYLRATITNLPVPGTEPEAAVTEPGAAPVDSADYGDDLAVSALVPAPDVAIPPPAAIATPIKLKTTPYQHKVIAERGKAGKPARGTPPKVTHKPVRRV